MEMGPGITEIAEQLSLDENTVRKGMGVLFRYLREHLPEDVFDVVASAYPPAVELSQIEGSVGMGEEVAGASVLARMEEAYHDRETRLGALYALMYSQDLERAQIGSLIGYFCTFMHRKLGGPFCETIFGMMPEMGDLHLEANRLLYAH